MVRRIHVRNLKPTFKKNETNLEVLFIVEHNFGISGLFDIWWSFLSLSADLYSNTQEPHHITFLTHYSYTVDKWHLQYNGVLRIKRRDKKKLGAQFLLMFRNLVIKEWCDIFSTQDIHPNVLQCAILRMQTFFAINCNLPGSKGCSGIQKLFQPV